MSLKSDLARKHECSSVPLLKRLDVSPLVSDDLHSTLFTLEYGSSTCDACWPKKAHRIFLLKTFFDVMFCEI